MRFDIETAMSLGAAGVVFGILNTEGAVDRQRTARLIEAARPLSVTFHKAFDETREPFGALEDLIDLGFERVLTAGHEETRLGRHCHARRTRPESGENHRHARRTDHREGFADPD